jgi:tRNA(Ile)-lysidine synthase
MIAKFKKHVAENFSLLANKKLFLAISGGIDSMVLLHLLQQMQYEIAILHCNFQLRGEESENDLKFVQNYAHQFEIPFSFVSFETETFAKENKLSIQVAARKLRYNWFNQQLINKKFDFLLTAHHADDDLETFIINFSRGTGLDGLVGIPAQNEKIIRPLLPFSRQEIEIYANENNLKWREDSSNSKDKYLRNNIRHNIIPLLKELNSDFLGSFQTTLNNLKQAQNLVEDATILIYQQVVSDEENLKQIDLQKLKSLPNYKAYLYQWLNPFGFSAWNDIYNLVESQSGKQVFSENFQLLKDRDFLLLSPKKSSNINEQYLINKNQELVNFPIKMTFCKVTDTSITSNQSIFVDENKLQFPLRLTKWKTGDSFFPFGMNGKSKKVSKFFKDEKLSLIEKENAWLLCSNNQIVWIVGMRQDERFKVDEFSKELLQITILE